MYTMSIRQDLNNVAKKRLPVLPTVEEADLDIVYYGMLLYSLSLSLSIYIYIYIHIHCEHRWLSR